MKVAKHILPVIVIAQFCCTSLWFAGNAVVSDLVSNFELNSNALGHLTSSVQFGFITGTLIFAILTIADRFSPSKVFLFCSFLGALFNLGIIWEGHNLLSILSLRFLTGFFLAGIYPVGMKIAADYFKQGLGKALGYLVGALVLGTAFPHLLKDFTTLFSWKLVLFGTSLLALVGGLLMIVLVPDGKYRKAGQQLDLSAFFNVFKNRKFRAAAFGYFGHMWELYAFWTFVPLMIQSFNDTHTESQLNASLWSFIVIGIGGLACVFGGYIATYKGVKNTARTSLLLSCICCIVSPLLFTITSEIIFLLFLVFWGMVVITDSPLFSTLVAQNTSPQIKGTALTIVNCLGFAITIISIQLINSMYSSTGSNNIYMLLAIGPIFGLIALFKKS